MTEVQQQLNQPPLSYGILLYPGFEVLDIAGPTECLNTLVHNLKDHPEITLSVIGRPQPHDDKQPMDIDPYDPKQGGGKQFQQAQVYKPTHTFSTAPPLDMLLIPGGFGSLNDPLEVCPGEVQFLKDRFPSLKYLLTICTGSGIAARAGVLDGRKATSNKAVWYEITKLGPKTCWKAHARWVQDGNIWTTSGVSAGTDGMLAFLSTIYPKKTIDALLNGMEYIWTARKPDDDPFAIHYKRHDVCPGEKECSCKKQA